MVRVALTAGVRVSITVPVAVAVLPGGIVSVDNALRPANRPKCPAVAGKGLGLGIEGREQAFRAFGQESIISWSEVRFEWRRGTRRAFR